MKEDQNSKPQTPQHHFFNGLHIQHPKYEDEFIKDEVPELVLQVLSGKNADRDAGEFTCEQGLM